MGVKENVCKILGFIWFVLRLPFELANLIRRIFTLFFFEEEFIKMSCKKAGESYDLGTLKAQVSKLKSGLVRAVKFVMATCVYAVALVELLIRCKWLIPHSTLDILRALGYLGSTVEKRGQDFNCKLTI
jgi:hypothetical protein